MKNKMFTTYSLVFLFAVLPLAPLGAVQRGGESRIDAQADRILREMGEYLKTAKEFSFRADVIQDEIVGEHLILFGGVAQVSISRPNRFNAEFNGDRRQTRVVFDGKTVTLFYVAKNLYAVAEAPPEIDGALDHLFELYRSPVPLADLVYADPYRTLIENAKTGFVAGQHAVKGTRCHHLVFTKEEIDWQIWIEVGPRPVPRRLVITYVNEPGSPQYIAELSDWNFQPRLSEHYFTFRPPEGSDEIEFLPPQERTPPIEEDNP